MVERVQGQEGAVAEIGEGSSDAMDGDGGEAVDLLQPRTVRMRPKAVPVVESDLVDRIFEYLAAEFPQVAVLDGGRLAELKLAVRAEFRGERVYVGTRGEIADGRRKATAAMVLRLFNGRNATEVARRLQISRATVYRLLKQPGRAEQSGGNEWTDYCGGP